MKFHMSGCMKLSTSEQAELENNYLPFNEMAANRLYGLILQPVNSGGLV